MIKWLLFPFGGEAKARRTILSPVSFGEDETILEMCSGTGGATFYISEKAENKSKIIGIDLSGGQLKQAQKRNYICPTHFIEGNVTQAPFQDESFDKVFVSHAIHEMSRKLRYETLEEAKRVLKTNGDIIIMEMDIPPSLFIRIFLIFWTFFWLPGNFERPTLLDMLKHGLITEVKENGFRDVRKYSAYRNVFQTIIGKK